MLFGFQLHSHTTSNSTAGTTCYFSFKDTITQLQLLTSTGCCFSFNNRVTQFQLLVQSVISVSTSHTISTAGAKCHLGFNYTVTQLQVQLLVQSVISVSTTQSHNFKFSCWYKVLFQFQSQSHDFKFNCWYKVLFQFQPHSDRISTAGVKCYFSFNYTCTVTQLQLQVQSVISVSTTHTISTPVTKCYLSLNHSHIISAAGTKCYFGFNYRVTWFQLLVQKVLFWFHPHSHTISTAGTKCYFSFSHTVTQFQLLVQSVISVSATQSHNFSCWYKVLFQFQPHSHTISAAGTKCYFSFSHTVTQFQLLVQSVISVSATQSHNFNCWYKVLFQFQPHSHTISAAGTKCYFSFSHTVTQFQLLVQSVISVSATQSHNFSCSGKVCGSLLVCNKSSS